MWQCVNTSADNATKEEVQDNTLCVFVGACVLYVARRLAVQCIIPLAWVASVIAM
jgi:hypothetical protein